MNDLYPLKFNPIYIEKIWGSRNLKSVLNKDIPENKEIGESWEISGVEDKNSIVCNGFLEDNELNELIEIYMGDLVGDRIYDKFGNQFPLLIKFIDANKPLSVQVHPNDKIAKEKYEASGKTEMWYILHAKKDSELISGFNHEMDKEHYLNHFNKNEITNILNFEKVKEGDVFYIPAGRVHSIGSGIVLAEIQQTSDITFRIYDWDRKDDSGNSRELHTQEALDSIDFTTPESYKENYKNIKNSTSEILSTPYFETSIIDFDINIEKDYNQLDSFVIYICTDGEFEIKYYDNEKIKIKKGETVLIPSAIEHLTLIPVVPSKLLEVYIPDLENEKNNKK
ncbi:MAG: class I mannose-6-phosphate isomerase [Bacteroidales bacterium]|nr:class I mannose-6-phosphate isomerase [Bacteroidales bacterium]